MGTTEKEARELVSTWRLGQTSERYESSGQGAGVVSTGRGDHGGASYGTYQLSSREGTLREYLQQSRYGQKFQGLSPATPAFNEKWKQVAHDDPGFGKDQHEFIGRSHYGTQMQRLQHAGLDLHDRGRAVQDCVWSTSVQLRNLTPMIVRNGLGEKFGKHFKLESLTDRQIVEAVQDYKSAHNATLFASSPQWHANLLRRAHHERADLVRLAEAERIAHRAIDRPADPRPSHPVHVAPHGSLEAPRSSTKIAQGQLAHLGYTGLDGRLLKTDGYVGGNTRHALEQYQRDHGIVATGQLDPRTRGALTADDRTMASSTHPAHAMYRQALDAVCELDRHLGVPSGKHSISLAGVVAAEAVSNGLSRIDRVDLGKDATHARAVEFVRGVDDPARNRTSLPIDVSRAVAQPLEISSQHAAEALLPRSGTREPPGREPAPMRSPVL